MILNRSLGNLSNNKISSFEYNVSKLIYKINYKNSRVYPFSIFVYLSDPTMFCMIISCENRCIKLPLQSPAEHQHCAEE